MKKNKLILSKFSRFIKKTKKSKRIKEPWQVKYQRDNPQFFIK